MTTFETIFLNNFWSARGFSATAELLVFVWFLAVD